ncbi:MAG TPA: cytochrome C biogenesis protein [Gammaproteobacteria bacterium]|nr:cytochrome C biogenesis protein [Gammaproteobacteria bacterium]
MYTIGLATLAVILYLLTSAALTLRLAGAETGHHVRRGTVLTLGFGAVILHAMVLYPEVFTGHGLDLAFFNAASLVALLTAVVLLLAALRLPVENLGIPVLPIAAATVALASWNPGHRSAITAGSWQLDLHILFSVLAYSLFALAAVQAILLAIQERHLRNRHPGGFIRALPPLQVMEQLLFQMIGTGFALLSAALLSGFLFLEDIFAQHLVHKTILSMSAWVIFGILLWGRWKFGWRGRTAIRWTLSGFVLLLLAYFGSKFVLEMILHKNA